MELTQEFIESNGLSEEQVSAFTGYLETEIVPSIKKEYDGKANENAENILSGAAKRAKELFKVDLDRDQGEKWGDYLDRISKNSLSSKNAELEQKEKEIQQKLANFKGGEEYKSQLEKLNQEKDALLKQVAELEPLKGIDEKYKQASETLTGLKKEVAYNSVKPNFPDTVNKYEADAKWNEWKRGVEEKFTIELVDGVPMAIDKENHHKVVKLSDLISADNSINELLKGRQQGGTGANPVNLKAVEGVPFKVPIGATSEERSTLIREYLEKKGINRMSDQFAKEFAELNLKIASSK